MALERLDNTGYGSGTQEPSSFDLFEAWYKQPWQDGYQFGDVTRTLGRLTSVFGNLGGSDNYYNWLKDKTSDAGLNVTSQGVSDISDSGSGDLYDPDINPIIDASQTTSDASVYGKVQGSTVEEKLKWLAENDPENSQGWLEQLLGLQAARENTQQARDYEKEFYGQRAQMLMKDLEAAGINPILASQYVGGSSSVGTAGVPDSSVSTNATSRYTTRLDNAVANNKTLAGIISALIAAVGLAAKGYISKR